ncbi:MAG: hypothetical protein F6K15_07775, partial [Okeania sp. SIO2B3]|nr:hypothetical protein [Okeania sp. SIO2B3]
MKYPQIIQLTEYQPRQFTEEIEEYFPMEELIEILEEVNQEINDPHYQVGVSFFLRENID